MNYKLNNVTLMIFTDIDGTFIDNDTFYEGDNFDIAHELCASNHVFVFNSSKTFHEIISLQTKHSTNYPFICETGGGIYHRSLPQHEPCKIRGDYDVIFESKKVSSFQRLIKEEIYKKFFSKKYYCYMTGFIAGMPFLGDLNASLYARRLDTPRVKVPKNSIGLTEQFCNIYTFESPGGWNIIGKTPLDIFDNKNNTSPNLINPGDTISFFQISKSEFEKKYG